MELELRQELSVTKSENLKLHNSMTALQEKYRTMTTEVNKKRDQNNFMLKLKNSLKRESVK
jgi:hypothetical protein